MGNAQVSESYTQLEPLLLHTREVPDAKITELFMTAMNDFHHSTEKNVSLL